MFKKFVFHLAAIVALSSATHAYGASRSHVIVVNLADRSLQWKILTLSSQKSTTCAGESPTIRHSVAELITLFAGNVAVTPSQDPNIARGMALASCFANQSESRFISSKGDLVRIFVLYNGGDGLPTVQYKETKRLSRFESDLQTLAQLILSGKLPTQKADEIPLVYQETHVLAEDRATLAVGSTPAEAKPSAQSPKGLDAIAAALAQVAQALDKSSNAKPTSSDAPSSHAVSASILTGSQEHWFIGANVNVTRYSQLSLDSDTNKIIPKEKSPQFLLSANYFLGDLASSSSNNLYVGFAFAPTSTPTRAMGPIVGVRFHTIHLLGLSLDAITPYVGYVRTTNDDAVAPADQVRWRPVAGLAFSLDKVVEWLK